MRWILVLIAACSGAPAKPTPPRATCPADLAMPRPGHCVLGTECPIADGMCICETERSGQKPPEGADRSLWLCGRTRGRGDGCPDALVEGTACTGTPAWCDRLEGQCEDTYTCTAGHWVATGEDPCPKPK